MSNHCLSKARRQHDSVLRRQLVDDKKLMAVVETHDGAVWTPEVKGFIATPSNPHSWGRRWRRIVRQEAVKRGLL